MLNLIFVCVCVLPLHFIFAMKKKLPSWCVVAVVMSLLALLPNSSDYIKDKGKYKETIIVPNSQRLLRWFDSLKMQSMDRDLARFLQFISVFPSKKHNNIKHNDLSPKSKHDRYTYVCAHKNVMGISCNRSVKLFLFARLICFDFELVDS